MCLNAGVFVYKPGFGLYLKIQFRPLYTYSLMYVCMYVMRPENSFYFYMNKNLDKDKKFNLLPAK